MPEPTLLEALLTAFAFPVALAVGAVIHHIFFEDDQ